MKQLILLFGIALSFFLTAWADEQPVKDPCHYSTEGTDFWFGFMQNRNTGEVHYTEITVTSRLGAQISVTYGSGETLIDNYTIGSNASVTIPINYSLLMVTGKVFLWVYGTG